MKRDPRTLSDSDYERVIRAAREALPRVLPGAWTASVLGENATLYAFQVGPRRLLKVIAEVELHDGNRLWLHASVSINSGKEQGILPTYRELTLVKDIVIGPQLKAFQVFAPEAEHYSEYEVLHLWAPLGFDPLDDLRREDGRL
jgi:hypothetical protein